MLLHYASSQYESSVRQNALEALLTLDVKSDRFIERLFLATQHHKWQFTSFARENVRKLLKKPEFRSRVEELAKTADEKTAALYEKFLKE